MLNNNKKSVICPSCYDKWIDKGKPMKDGKAAINCKISISDLDDSDGELSDKNASNKKEKSDVSERVESGRRILSLIKKAETKRAAKRKIVKYLQKKGVSESKIIEAYNAYYKEEGLFEFTFNQRPLGFSVKKDANGKNAIVSSIHEYTNDNLGMKVGWSIYEINGKRVDDLKRREIIKIMSQQPCPLFIIFKENQNKNSKCFCKKYNYASLFKPNEFDQWDNNRLTWHSLKELRHSSDTDVLTNFILVNEEELFAVSWDCVYKDVSIYKYFISQKKSIRFSLKSFHNYLFQSNIDHICKDENEQYIICYQSSAVDLVSNGDNKSYPVLYNPKIITIDLYEKKLKQYVHNVPDVGKGSKSIITNSQYHIIGGSKNINHFIWNQKEETFENRHSFHKLKTGLINFGLLYIETERKLIVFGGLETGTNTRVNTMWNYSFDCNKWSEMNVKMPIKVDEFGYVKTSNERYIILIGGSVSSAVANDAIFVFDIDSMQWHKSKAKPPKYTPFDAVITASDEIYLFEKYGNKLTWTIDANAIVNSYNMELVNSYVRHCWIMLELDVERYLSKDILKLIQMFRE